MIFKITTEKGSEIELDSQDIEAVELEIDGKRYQIEIKEL